jgi:hypothetical protein
LLAFVDDCIVLASGPHLELPASGAVGLGVGTGNARFDDIRVRTDTPLGDRRSYFYHGGQRVAVRAAGVVYCLKGDHLGSVSPATDDGGAWETLNRITTRLRAHTIPTGVTYDVEVIVRGTEVALVADGEHKVATSLGAPISGSVGLRIVHARTWFDDVEVAPLTVTHEDFEHTLDDWTVVAGTWRTEGAAFSGQADGSQATILSPDRLSEGRLAAVVTSLDWPDHSTNGALVFDYDDAANYSFGRMAAASDKWMLGEYVSGQSTARATYLETIDTGVPYSLSVVLQDGWATL